MPGKNRVNFDPGCREGFNLCLILSNAMLPVVNKDVIKHSQSTSVRKERTGLKSLRMLSSGGH